MITQQQTKVTTKKVDPTTGQGDDKEGRFLMDEGYQTRCYQNVLLLTCLNCFNLNVGMDILETNFHVMMAAASISLPIPFFFLVRVESHMLI